LKMQVRRAGLTTIIVEGLLLLGFILSSNLLR
jgi:hypothetical protein